MPRSAKNRNPNNTIPPKDWFVYSYEIKDEEVIRGMVADESERTLMSEESWGELAKIRSIVKTDEQVVSRYALSDHGVHEELLEEYSSIGDASQGLKYVRAKGLPGNDNFMSIADIQDSAAYLRHLLFLSEAISTKDIKTLDKWFRPTSIGPKYVTIEMRSPSGDRVHAFRTICLAIGINPCREIEPPVVFTKDTWDLFGTKAVLYAAQHYLKIAVDRLLVGVQPSLDWKMTLDGDWILDESIAVETPWQAICFALLRNITGKGHLKSCEYCRIKWFRQKRGDHYFCSPACTRASSRKNGPKVHSYPKKKNGE